MFRPRPGVVARGEGGGGECQLRVGDSAEEGAIGGCVDGGKWPLMGMGGNWGGGGW